MIPFHRTAGLPVAVLILSVLVGGTPNALAMPSLQIQGGILVGANGVDVGGTLYDVTFMDGTCQALFGGCDATSDFVFQDAAAGLVASQALLNQVLIDGPAGLFDTFPAHTQGCDSQALCMIWTPVSLSGSTVTAISVFNYSMIVDSTGLELIDSTTDLQNYLGNTWAVWTEAHHAVPEPATSVLLTSGLLGIAGYRWRQRRQAGAQVG